MTTGAGNDSVYGGTGNDILDGGTGKDLMLGGSHDDTFKTTLGDTVIGGAGNDIIQTPSGTVEQGLEPLTTEQILETIEQNLAAIDSVVDPFFDFPDLSDPGAPASGWLDSAGSDNLFIVEIPTDIPAPEPTTSPI